MIEEFFHLAAASVLLAAYFSWLAFFNSKFSASSHLHFCGWAALLSGRIARIHPSSSCGTFLLLDKHIAMFCRECIEEKEGLLLLPNCEFIISLEVTLELEEEIKASFASLLGHIIWLLHPNAKGGAKVARSQLSVFLEELNFNSLS